MNPFFDSSVYNGLREVLIDRGIIPDTKSIKLSAMLKELLNTLDDLTGGDKETKVLLAKMLFETVQRSNRQPSPEEKHEDAAYMRKSMKSIRKKKAW